MAKEPEFVAPEMPKGWTLSGWVHHLRRVADVCEPHDPERAKYLRKWAEDAIRNAGRGAAELETPDGG